ncbi:MAG: isocitrate/isopropylmalate family dehydrogenase, partial [Planctomycetota bacterium JB042]
SIKPISVSGTDRIVRFAFEYARKHHRRKVTAVHKANIMKFSDGLFLDVAHDVAKEYKDIEFSHRIVDNMCMQLVQYPWQYDVLVLPNLYGDIISDLAAGMIGGLGLAPGANVGKDVAVFEATHGSAPDIAGMDRANPVGLILSAVLMLRHLGEREAATWLEGAVANVLHDGTHVTADLKDDPHDPTAVGTTEMGAAIIERVHAHRAHDA